MVRLTDIIAQAIQQMIDEDGGRAEIQRNELASRIGCVPSQINYVITSRFTPEQGYIVESRRGGGGYIRIVRIPHEQVLMHVLNSLGDRIDERSSRVILQNLLGDGVIGESSARLIATAVSERTLKDVPNELRDRVRATLLKQLLLIQA